MRTLTEYLGGRAIGLKERGEAAQYVGIRAADMTRDELLMFLGAMCEVQTGQGEQLAKAANRIEALTSIIHEQEKAKWPRT